jgi:DNA-binding GntR family transcriptional regulator
MQKSSNNSLSRKAQAYDYIKHRIITCEYVPDAPISEKDLMLELQMSRTPIREALNSLAGEHLVQIYPKRGIFVAGISEKDIIDIYTIRETIEPVAAQLASYYISEESLISIRTGMQRHLDSFSPDEHLKIDREFHMLIAESCNNEYLKKILINMYDHNSRIRHRIFNLKITSTSRMEEAINEHQALIDCLLARDAEGAKMAMVRHIAHGKSAALRIMNPILT